MDDFEVEIKKDFITEAQGNQEEAEACFMDLETAEDPKSLLEKIFRLAHNLKGGSRAVGFGDIAELTHNFENLVLKVQKGERELNSVVVTLFLDINDRLSTMLADLKIDMAAKFDNHDLISRILALLDGAQASAPVIAAAEASEDPTEHAQESAPEPLHAVQATDSPRKRAPEKKAKQVADGDEMVRIPLAKISRLNDYVGELIVLQSVLNQQIQRGENNTDSLRMMGKISKDIQNVSMSLRLVSVKPMIQKLQRVVRDTAQALEKEVELEVFGEGLEIDKSVFDKLGDPLIHIIRNAMDHGLELPHDRVIAGKNQAGKVKLSLRNLGNDLVVEVSDDGKGINHNILRKKAIEKRIIRETDNLSKDELVNLIFHAGFSTKAATSEISGRGVGMDVVKTNIEEINGSVKVLTEIDKGSQFILKIPLTLAVIEGIVVTAQGSRYVFPLSQVHQTINLRAQNLKFESAGVGKALNLRGEVVPLFDLGEVIKSKTKSEIEGNTALITMVDGQLHGLIVDEILRSQQIVVKPINKGIVEQKGWIGTCVLGDGLPTLILNPVELLRGRILSSDHTTYLGSAA